jgi:transposase
LVFVDESGASTMMTLARGRAKRGQRYIAAVPHGHWKTTTFVGGLTLGGINAPMTLDGSIDGVAFIAWIEQMLELALFAGMTVVMDNLPAHKLDAVPALIEACGAKLHFLPPYSPDLNPIEMAYSKFKAFLKKAAARTLPNLTDGIANALPAITPRDCKSNFAQAGYGSK